MDRKIEEKKGLFKTGFRVLQTLQSELFSLDADVSTVSCGCAPTQNSTPVPPAQAKKNYDAAMKEHQHAVKKKSGPCDICTFCHPPNLSSPPLPKAKSRPRSWSARSRA